MQALSDQAIIDAITAGGSGRQQAIRQIYYEESLKRKVIHFVQQNNGNFQDGQDMFHEGIIVLDRNIRQGKFRGESPLQGYLYSICRFLWMNQIRKKARVDLKEDHAELDETEENTPEVAFLSEEKKRLLRALLNELGERCRKILELWQLSFSMEEIAEKLEFSSAAMARKAKYRCQQSLVKLLEENPKWREEIE